MTGLKVQLLDIYTRDFSLDREVDLLYAHSHLIHVLDGRSSFTLPLKPTAIALLRKGIYKGNKDRSDTTTGQASCYELNASFCFI